MKGKRKPLEIEKLQGTPGRRPLKVAPKTKVINEQKPPAYMRKDAKTEWKRIIKIYKTIGLITESDLKVLEGYSNITDRLTYITNAINIILKKKIKDKDDMENLKVLMGLELKYLAQLKIYCGELGFSPAARARVGVKPEKPKEKNEIKDFLNRKCKIE